MKKIPVALICILGLIGIAQAQQNYLITKNSVGNVRLGMTVAQARKALKGFNLRRVSDGDGVALIQVKKNGRYVMHLFAGEENPEAKINEKAKIEFIEVFDGAYKNADGIRPEMLVKNAERMLGKVERVFISEIEGREFTVFSKKPKGLSFRVAVSSQGKYLYAGIYLNEEREGKNCVPTAFILSIQVLDY